MSNNLTIAVKVADELGALIAAATDEDLADGGRYFGESGQDLTQCRHNETGEYQCSHDGELIEFLWNNRLLLLHALHVAATINVREAAEKARGMA